jgi:hypothetical protein
MTLPDLAQISPDGADERTGTITAEAEKRAFDLDRRVCVAPMMDYTGEAA